MDTKKKSLLTFLFFFGWAVVSSAQGAGGAVQEGVVSVAKLSPPVYPMLARQTRVTGDVDLELKIRSDGRVVSAASLKGHPLLAQAALDSAQRSQYMCVGCGEEPRIYRLLYTFELGPAINCEKTDPNAKQTASELTYPQVTQSKDHITVVDRGWRTCDFAGTSESGKYRSIKCLYLWRCASRLVVYE